MFHQELVNCLSACNYYRRKVNRQVTILYRIKYGPRRKHGILNISPAPHKVCTGGGWRSLVFANQLCDAQTVPRRDLDLFTSSSFGLLLQFDGDLHRVSLSPKMNQSANITMGKLSMYLSLLSVGRWGCAKPNPLLSPPQSPMANWETACRLMWPGLERTCCSALILFSLKFIRTETLPMPQLPT